MERIHRDVLEDNEEIVEAKTIPIVSMCGSMMTIPKPKRERYGIVCSYPNAAIRHRHLIEPTPQSKVRI